MPGCLCQILSLNLEVVYNILSRIRTQRLLDIIVSKNENDGHGYRNMYV
jgi:hypothetical protein